MQTIQLKRPVTIDGKQVKSIDLDFDALTNDQYIAAEGKAKAKRGVEGTAFSAELDYAFQLYLAYYAAIAADPKLDISDLERITGRDIVSFQREGRDFLLESEAEETVSPESSSDDASAGTPKSTTHPSTK